MKRTVTVDEVSILVLSKSRNRHWRFNLLLTLGLLGLWLLTAFVPTFFARKLDHVYLFDWPLAFWMAAFGGPIIFLTIIATYAHVMDRCDQRWRLERAAEQAKANSIERTGSLR